MTYGPPDEAILSTIKAFEEKGFDWADAIHLTAKKFNMKVEEVVSLWTLYDTGGIG